MKPFPGVPEDSKEDISKIFFEAAALVNSGNTVRGKQVEKIFLTMGKCVLNPPAYFDLYMSLAPLMPEQFEWWNKEVYEKKFGASNPGNMDLEGISILGEAPEVLKEIDAEGFNMFLALCYSIRTIKNEENNTESIQILDALLWCVYISMMRNDFFDKNYKVIMAVGKRASKGKSNITANRISLN